MSVHPGFPGFLTRLGTHVGRAGRGELHGVKRRRYLSALGLSVAA